MDGKDLSHLRRWSGYVWLWKMKAYFQASQARMKVNPWAVAHIILVPYYNIRLCHIIRIIRLYYTYTYIYITVLHATI